MYRIVFLLLFAPIALAAQPSAFQRSVVLEASYDVDQSAIELQWLPDSTARSYRLYRKALADEDWGPLLATLSSSDSSYTDPGVASGTGYEYALFKEEFGPVRDTFCVAAGSQLRFEIKDMYNIGLCCSFGFGYYRIEGCGQVLFEGSDFGTSQIHQFELCQGLDSCEKLVIELQPDMFPNSTSWRLYDDQTNELLASSGAEGTFVQARPAYGYIYAGHELPAVHDRGSILLVVESSVDQELQPELEQLCQDLRMDGWTVAIQLAEADESVAVVRDRIKEVYDVQGDLEVVYLIGHVPVPYSGDIYPDTHTEHRGAWAADTYYGEMDGNWTDTIANRATAQFAYNHNVPGDGRFDQDSIPSAMELAVGRVDFFNMPAFAQSEVELLRAYLRKSHLYKVGQLPYVRKALIDDNFRQAFAAPAASGWRNFGPLVGKDNIYEQDYFTTLSEEPFLWAYGCGGGSHISAEGIGTTADFARDSLQGIFSMLFGSQFGDWDNENNFLRAPLASGHILTNCWAGNPPYAFHHMAMGFPIAYSLLRTQNSQGAVYQPGPQLVHTALMGDPSLRLYAYPNGHDLQAEQRQQEVQLNWRPSPDPEVLGYYIYRSTSPNEPFNLLTADWISDTSYTDSGLAGMGDATATYILKAVKLEQSPSGSYYHLSLGISDTVDYKIFVSLSESPDQNGC
ncbi:MAG: hypothetical protein AAFV25_11615 [Bacteroidota bacterium]